MKFNDKNNDAFLLFSVYCYYRNKGNFLKRYMK